MADSKPNASEAMKKPLDDWSCDEVCDVWLSSLNNAFVEEIKLFREKCVEGDDLVRWLQAGKTKYVSEENRERFLFKLEKLYKRLPKSKANQEVEEKEPRSKEIKQIQWSELHF